MATKYPPIRNKQEHREALARLCAGTDYIASPQFSKLPQRKQQAAKARFNQIETAILIYQGMEWAVHKEKVKA